MRTCCAGHSSPPKVGGGVGRSAPRSMSSSVISPQPWVGRRPAQEPQPVHLVAVSQSLPLMERLGCRELCQLAAGETKVTVVGAGAVGLAAAYAILIKGFGKPLVLIDVAEDKAVGEALDLRHALAFTNSEGVLGGKDYSLSEGSKIVVIAAGKAQKPTQSRIDLLQDNIAIMKSMMTQLMKYSPHAFYIIASNPADILAYAAWKISGLPQSKVFGTGTNLDSARFRYYVSEFLGVPVQDVEGCVIGEHGDSSVPVWSHVKVIGKPMSLLEDLISEEDQEKIHQEVKNSAAELIKLKGNTSSAIGMSIADIVESILYNRNKVICVSTLIKGEYGTESDTFSSLPCIVGGHGISHIVPLQLSEHECNMFRASVEAVTKAQESIQHLLQ